MDWEVVKTEYMPWLIGPAALVCWVTILSIVKKNIFGRIHKLAGKTQTEVDDVLMSALNFPINLIILLSGIYIVQALMPLPEKISLYAGYTMKVLMILSAIFFLDQFVRGFMTMKAVSSEFVNSTQGIMQGIIRAFILVIGALVLLEALGISITPLIASLGIGSLAIALALKDTLANLFSGVFLLVDKPIQPGQYIELEDGKRGFVEDIGLRSTRIRTRRDITVVIPNDKIVNSIISNYHQPEKDFSHRTQITVSYDSDLDHVENVTLEVAKEVQENIEGAVEDYSPYIRYLSFGENGVTFYVNLRVKGYHKRRRVMHNFLKRLHVRYKEEGITIPYPQRTVRLVEQDRKLLSDVAEKLGDS